jgi:hypothetical protein
MLEAVAFPSCYMPGVLLGLLHVLLSPSVWAVILSEGYYEFPFTDEEAEAQNSSVTNQDYIAYKKQRGASHPSHL